MKRRVGLEFGAIMVDEQRSRAISSLQLLVVSVTTDVAAMHSTESVPVVKKAKIETDGFFADLFQSSTPNPINAEVSFLRICR